MREVAVKVGLQVKNSERFYCVYDKFNLEFNLKFGERYQVEMFPYPDRDAFYVQAILHLTTELRAIAWTTTAISDTLIDLGSGEEDLSVTSVRVYSSSD